MYNRHHIDTCTTGITSIQASHRYKHHIDTCTTGITSIQASRCYLHTNQHARPHEEPHWLFHAAFAFTDNAAHLKAPQKSIETCFELVDLDVRHVIQHGLTQDCGAGPDRKRAITEPGPNAFEQLLVERVAEAACSWLRTQTSGAESMNDHAEAGGAKSTHGKGSIFIRQGMVCSYYAAAHRWRRQRTGWRRRQRSVRVARRTAMRGRDTAGTRAQTERSDMGFMRWQQRERE
jgi:hypothetical protein